MATERASFISRVGRWLQGSHGHAHNILNPMRAGSGWGAAGCMTPGLEAGSVGRRLAGWQPIQQHVNGLINAAGENIVTRARWLARNNGYARAAVRSWTAATVGAGIKPSSLVEEQDLRETINAAWLRWTDQADAEDITDFYGLTRRVAREAFLVGECFVRFRPRFPQDGLFVPLQLQVLPVEQLGTWQTLDVAENGNPIRLGIEYDANRRDLRVAYYFWRANPVDDTLSFSEALLTNELVRVPASEIIHVFDPVEAGQIRGLTGMVAAMVPLFLLDSYDEAEVEKKRQQARFATFIKRPDYRDANEMPFGLAPALNPQVDGGVPTFDQAYGDIGLAPRPGGASQPEDYYGPGATVVLYPGEDVTFANPGDSGAYEAFQYRTLLRISTALGIPYADLSQDLNRTTYASSRAGLVNFRQEVEAFQHAVLVFQFLRRVWLRWMDTAVLAGALPITPQAYAADAYRYQAMKAITPRAPWVDPLKDRQAEVLALRAGIKAPQDVIEAEGYDMEEVYHRIAEANELATELGITIDYGWSARATQQQQQTPTTAEPQQQSDEAA